jgi:hypothetical protein
MTLVERLSLHLTEEQCAEFLQLVEENPDTPVLELYHKIIRPQG